MKLLGKLVCTGSFLFLFYAAPAFAQFEVSPDHFDNIMNQTPAKPAVTPERQAARRHLGTGPAALQQSHTRKSQAQPARTGNAQVASAQRHGHVRKGGLSAKASAKVQPQRQTAQVARVQDE